MSNKKENIIFTASHLYLFWTTGVYYLWELSKKYNIILFVEKYYISDEMFMRLCKHLKIDKVVYYKMYRNPILSHYYFKKKCKNMVLEFSPQIIYHYNYEFIWNQYLAHWSNLLCNDCENRVYINGQWRKTPIEDIVLDNWENIITRISNKYFIPKRLIRKSLQLLRKMKRFVEYSLLPFIIMLGHIPRIKLVKTNSIPFKTILCYSDIEEKIIKDIINNNNDPLLTKIHIKKVKHPVQTCGNECNNFLYDSNQQTSILLFPSLLGFEDLQTELAGLNNWMEVGNILKRLFPENNIQLKMHPGVLGNPYLNNIIKYFEENCSNIELLHPSVNAQKLIINHKIIVAEVSTLIWWARFLKNKILISMDFGNVLGSDDMKYYDNIHYCDSLDKLEKFQFTY